MFRYALCYLSYNYTFTIDLTSNNIAGCESVGIVYLGAVGDELKVKYWPGSYNNIAWTVKIQ